MQQITRWMRLYFFYSPLFSATNVLCFGFSCFTIDHSTSTFDGVALIRDTAEFDRVPFRSAAHSLRYHFQIYSTSHSLFSGLSCFTDSAIRFFFARFFVKRFSFVRPFHCMWNTSELLFVSSVIDNRSTGKGCAEHDIHGHCFSCRSDIWFGIHGGCWCVTFGLYAISITNLIIKHNETEKWQSQWDSIIAIGSNWCSIFLPLFFSLTHSLFLFSVLEYIDCLVGPGEAAEKTHAALQILSHLFRSNRFFFFALFARIFFFVCELCFCWYFFIRNSSPVRIVIIMKCCICI